MMGSICTVIWCTSCLQILLTDTSDLIEQYCRLKGHLGMRVSAASLTPELMHIPYNSAQNMVVTVDVAEAAASVSS